MADRERPHLTRLGGARVGVCQSADCGGGLDTLRCTVEVAECDWGCPHQRAVSTCPAGECTCTPGHLGGTCTTASQHSPRLVADICWFRVVPGEEVRGDGVEAVAGADVYARS